MRPFVLALLMLCCAVPPALPAGTEAGRTELRRAARPAEARPPRAPRASAAALAAARAYLCPHGGTPQGRGRCTRGPGIGAGMGWLGDDPAVRDWDQGLAPPNRAQAPCPPGTIAMPARDQPQVTRCVAG